MRAILLSATIFSACACTPPPATEPGESEAEDLQPAPAQAPTDTDSGLEIAAASADSASQENGADANLESGAAMSDGADARSVDFGERNVPEFEPAFENQTRAPLPDATHDWTAETVGEGLGEVWGFTFLPDGDILLNKKSGTMHVLSDGEASDALTGLPEIDTDDQGGLLDVELDPDFADNRLVYFSYAEPRGEGENGTAVARARLSEDRSALEDLEVIFRQEPSWESGKHFGSRLVFAQDGTLYVTLGERSLPEPRQLAQDPTNHIGAVVRINRDGSIPDDNPFVGSDEGADAVYAYGTRNIQAAALGPQGRLWEIEHGPAGGDELNLIEAGGNYGWPVVGYGEQYDGTPQHENTQADGMIQPVYYWDPVIGPSGMIVYSGDRFEHWRGDIFVGGLVTEDVVRLTLEDDRVTGEERLEMDGRIRDVVQGPDGAIYVSDESNGTILRIAPGDTGAR
ncbi:PQQ-dependent sugar dehydrogenase [Maricaulaceae bacterium MS644]